MNEQSTQFPGDSETPPTDAEVVEMQFKAAERALREALAMRNAMATSYRIHLERLLDLVEANGYDSKQARVVAGARKALCLSYDPDALEEYEKGGAF